MATTPSGYDTQEDEADAATLAQATASHNPDQGNDEILRMYHSNLMPRITLSDLQRTWGEDETAKWQEESYQHNGEYRGELRATLMTKEARLSYNSIVSERNTQILDAVKQYDEEPQPNDQRDGEPESRSKHDGFIKRHGEQAGKALAGLVESADRRMRTGEAALTEGIIRDNEDLIASGRRVMMDAAILMVKATEEPEAEAALLEGEHLSHRGMSISAICNHTRVEATMETIHQNARFHAADDDDAYRGIAGRMAHNAVRTDLGMIADELYEMLEGNGGNARGTVAYDLRRTADAALLRDTMKLEDTAVRELTAGNSAGTKQAYADIKTLRDTIAGLAHYCTNDPDIIGFNPSTSPEYADDTAMNFIAEPRNVFDRMKNLMRIQTFASRAAAGAGNRARNNKSRSHTMETRARNLEAACRDNTMSEAHRLWTEQQRP